MLAKTYISIQGAAFSPAEFQKLAGGDAKRRRSSGAPLTDVQLDYWTSRETSGAVSDVAIPLLTLAIELKGHLESLGMHHQLQVIAHVVLEYSAGEEPTGLYVSPELVGALSHIGASLDVDAVQR